MKGLNRLKVIQEISQNRPEWIHTDLFRNLRKEDIWFAAYENIKGNKGALTPVVTKETLDRTRIGKIRRLQQKVLDERYQFHPVKQTWIHKANRKRRPIGLPTPDYKIVQEVIRLTLEAIYEPIFDNRSFGFRIGKGAHDALSYVEDEFRWMDWVIKGEIQTTCPIINHSSLRTILAKKIKDHRFLRLINKSLKCGVSINSETFSFKIGVPQRSIVYPILVNIYFHELDKWITQKEKELFEKKSSKRHSKYKQLEYQINKVSKELEKTIQNSKEQKDLRRKIKFLIAERNQTPSLLEKGIEIRYVRYMDDWIIGIKGPIQLAKQLKEEVNDFFQNQLHQELDSEKTKILNLRSGKISFLGYEIFLPRNMKLVKYKKKKKRQTVRRQSPTLSFQLPVKIIIQRLHKRGYIVYENNRWRPVSKRSYSSLEDEVIVRHFQSVWRGLFNFYSGTTNRSHLQYIHYLLHMSCAMTLAHRHRSSSTKIFKKRGKRLEILDQKKDTPKVIAYFPYQTNWKVSNRRWQTAKEFRNPFMI